MVVLRGGRGRKIHAAAAAQYVGHPMQKPIVHDRDRRRYFIGGSMIRCAPLNPRAASEIIYARSRQVESVDAGPDKASDGITNGTLAPCRSGPNTVDPAIDLARCFLRLANLPTYPLDRLSRYEAILWRQAGQILFALEGLDRRKPQKRGRRFPIGSRQDLPADGRDDY